MGQSEAERAFDPRRGQDRIHALLQSYTSPVNNCPYYDKKIRSTCAIDPRSRRAWDCHGMCFTDGFCCNRILDKTAEVEKLMKVLWFFPSTK